MFSIILYIYRHLNFPQAFDNLVTHGFYNRGAKWGFHKSVPSLQELIKLLKGIYMLVIWDLFSTRDSLITWWEIENFMFLRDLFISGSLLNAYLWCGSRQYLFFICSLVQFSGFDSNQELALLLITQELRIHSSLFAKKSMDTFIVTGTFVGSAY